MMLQSERTCRVSTDNRQRRTSVPNVLAATSRILFAGLATLACLACGNAESTSRTPPPTIDQSGLAERFRQLHDSFTSQDSYVLYNVTGNPGDAEQESWTRKGGTVRRDGVRIMSDEALGDSVIFGDSVLECYWSVEDNAVDVLCESLASGTQSPLQEAYEEFYVRSYHLTRTASANMSSQPSECFFLPVYFGAPSGTMCLDLTGKVLEANFAVRDVRYRYISTEVIEPAQTDVSMPVIPMPDSKRAQVTGVPLNQVSLPAFPF